MAEPLTSSYAIQEIQYDRAVVAVVLGMGEILEYAVVVPLDNPPLYRRSGGYELLKVGKGNYPVPRRVDKQCGARA